MPRLKLASAMLAGQLSSQIFDLDVQSAAASWAFLNEIGIVLHFNYPLELVVSMGDIISRPVKVTNNTLASLG